MIVPSFLRTERVLMLGTTALAEQVVAEIVRRPGSRYRVVGVVDDTVPGPDHFAGELFAGHLSSLPEVVKKLRPHRIVVALTERRERRGKSPMATLLESYVSRDVIVEDVTEFYERLTGQIALESLTPMGVIKSGNFRPFRFHQVCARALSLSIAAIALLALSPVLVLIALAIKLDSSGPVLFPHVRVGAHGRPFTLLKFRTMMNGCARRSEWERDNRDHVTRVGKYLRRFRLDELPQLINILRGEMNLVGPRPHPVTNFELFTLVARNLNEVTGAAIGCYSLRLIVRPGLTGWAQVRYRYANNLVEEIEKLRYDLYYVKHMSFWFDLRIIMETIGAFVLERDRDAETEPRGADAAATAGSETAFLRAKAPTPRGFQRKLGHTTES